MTGKINPTFMTTYLPLVQVCYWHDLIIILILTIKNSLAAGSLQIYLIVWKREVDSETYCWNLNGTGVEMQRKPINLKLLLQNWSSKLFPRDQVTFWLTRNLLKNVNDKKDNFLTKIQIELLCIWWQRGPFYSHGQKISISTTCCQEKESSPNFVN